MTQDGNFFDYFRKIEADKLVLDQVLWVVPRVDLASVLKKQLAQFCGCKVQQAAWVQSADRLSQPKALGPWLNCLAQLVLALKKENNLSNGIKGQQLWVLASEILTYAMRLGLQKQAKLNLQEYSLMSQFSEREVAFIIQVAEVFSEELLELWVKPNPQWQGIQKVIWFNDCEALPEYWLNAFLPGVPIIQIKLPLIRGDQPWRQLFAGQAKPGFKLSCAPNEHTQAQQAAAIIANWLQQDETQEVVVAVVDRLAARWLVPVLSQLNIQVDDRTGWQLSTSVAAGWFDGIISQIREVGVLVSLTHPFTGEPLETFSGWQPGVEKQTLSAWAQDYLDLVDSLGLLDVFRNDRAGIGLLKAFRVLQTLPFADFFTVEAFQQAWRYQVEAMRFRPVDANSLVRLTPLLSTRMHAHSRVLVLGCAQSHFQESPPGLLPPGVAFELGVMGSSLGRKQKISALWELAKSAQEVVFSHAQTVQGRPEILLPELQFVQALYANQFGVELDNRAKTENNRWLLSWKDSTIKVQPEKPYALDISSQRIALKLPETLHVTALDDWVKCPMRFGLSRLLGFTYDKDTDEKNFFQLRGMFVHSVLEKASRVMVLSKNTTDFESWKEPLYQAASSVFSSYDIKEQATLYPFLQFFMQLIPRIAGKLAARHQQGWFLSEAEKQVNGHLTLKSGSRIKLSGRIDRLEQRNGQTAIVDIKFKKAQVVRKQAKAPLDNPQLAAYQAILELPYAELLYLAIDSESVDWVPIEAPDQKDDALPFDSWGKALWHNLSEELDLFFGRQTWQAKPGEVCNTCPVFGVCRPDTLGDESV